MRARIKEPDFRPVTLSITFDTQKELDVFGSLFSTTAVAETLSEVVEDVSFPQLIYQAVVKAGGATKYTRDINNLLRKKF